MPTATPLEPFSIWRDIKTYGDYAFIVSDDFGAAHGMQIVDLPAVIAEAEEYQESGGGIYALDLNTTEHVTMYNGFGSCHNVC